jgi:hypothetical protein
MGKARCFADHDSDPGAAVASRAQFLDSALVEHRRGRGAIFDEDFGELTTSTHRFAQNSLQYLLLNQGGFHECERSWRLFMR